jgi:hypothetical protein
MIEEILESFVSSQGEHVKKTGNEYNVTDLMMCREKLRFQREGKPYEFVESDITRQAKLSNFVHSAMQAELRKLGWKTEKKFVKKIGEYTLHMRADAVMFEHQEAKKLAEIKCPMWNGMAEGKAIPDYYLFQIGMYLNITGAGECILMVLAKNGFTERVITKRMSDDDIIWLIEDGAQSPWFSRECENCWYKKYCEEK